MGQREKPSQMMKIHTANKRVNPWSAYDHKRASNGINVGTARENTKNACMNYIIICYLIRILILCQTYWQRQQHLDVSWWLTVMFSFQEEQKLTNSATYSKTHSACMDDESSKFWAFWCRKFISDGWQCHQTSAPITEC